MNPVADFEDVFRRKLGSDYAIAVNSGTSALHAALVACGVEGGEVVVPALCPAMVAFAVIHAKATPVYADVDPQTHLITPATISPVITSRTKAILAVALHGLPVDMDTINDLARQHDIATLEDCAQCLLGRYKDGYAGTKADMGCFSFEKKKHMSTGSEGGMIITSNSDLAMKARKFAGLGYQHMTAEVGRTSLSAATYQRPDYQRFDTIGLNYRMSEYQAAVGLFVFQNVDELVAKRQKIAQKWEDAIGEKYTIQDWDYYAINSHYTFAMEYGGRDWVSFYNEFVRRGGDGFYAMPQCPYREPALDRELYSYPPCPTAESLQQRLMLFKTHYQDLTMAQKQADILAGMLHDGW